MIKRTVKRKWLRLSDKLQKCNQAKFVSIMMQKVFPDYILKRFRRLQQMPGSTLRISEKPPYSLNNLILLLR